MYAAIRQYEIAAGSVADFMSAVDASFADKVKDQPGFVAYHVVASGSDEIVAVSIFDDEDSATRSNALAAEFVRDHLGEFLPTLTSALSGEVMVSRASVASAVS
jgi:hypothetical protein